jgi:hypothetical protein
MENSTTSGAQGAIQFFIFDAVNHVDALLSLDLSFIL